LRFRRKNVKQRLAIRPALLFHAHPNRIRAKRLASHLADRRLLNRRTVIRGHIAARLPVADSPLDNPDTVGKPGLPPKKIDSDLQCIHGEIKHDRDYEVNTLVSLQHGQMTAVDSIASRLARARERAGLTQQQLGNLAGVSQSTIGNIEAGLRQSRGSLPQIAEALGVRLKWLRDGEEPGIDQLRRLVEMSDNPDYPAIRRARFKLSAGASGFAVEYDEGDAPPIVFRKEWFVRRGLRHDRLFAVEVTNGSMEPGLYAGDTVVVNTDETQERDGEVFAMNYEGELVIKRLVRDEGQWWLASDNPDQRRFPRKLCDERVFIVGRIVHKQSEHI
jgi:phage repressor protein C with HTH and peptisase S24 domain